MALTNDEIFFIKEIIDNPNMKELVDDIVRHRPDAAELIEQLKNDELKKEKINNDYKTLICDYIDYGKDKFASIITKSQYAIKIGMIPHEDMVKELIQKTRPDIELDGWGNAVNPNESYTNGNIVIAGYPGYVLIELPNKELLSTLQFDCLKDILLEYKKSNIENTDVVVYGNGIINIEGRNYNNSILELINKLSKYVSDDVVVPKEEIIGISLEDYKKMIDEHDDGKFL